jgi:histidinol-phosphatase (PHP family)
MDGACARAVEIGLRSIAFTEHADFTPWAVSADAALPDEWSPLLREGTLTPPLLDLGGYESTLADCRDRYPTLRILSGVELSEPHWHDAQAAALLDRGGFERVLASVHSGIGLAPGTFAEISSRYEYRTPQSVVVDYLQDIARMVEQFQEFEVLAHIDYPVRYWPQDAPPYDPHHYEEQYRHVLDLLAERDLVLEVNTRVPLHFEVVSWWREAGGARLSFASDAHEPSVVAYGFGAAADMAEAAGFHPDGDHLDFWWRA